MTDQLTITQAKDTNILVKEGLLYIFKKRLLIIAAIYAFSILKNLKRDSTGLVMEDLIISVSIITLILIVGIGVLIFRIKKYLKGRQVTYTLSADMFSAVTLELSVNFKWEEILKIIDKKEQSLIDKSQLSLTQTEALNKLFNSLKGRVKVVLK